jgi:hypothetical protein
MIHLKEDFMINLDINWEEHIRKAYDKIRHGKYCKTHGTCPCLQMTVNQRVKEINKLIANGEALIKDI